MAMLLLGSFTIYAQYSETIYNAIDAELSLKKTPATIVLSPKAFDTTGAIYVNGPLVTHPGAGAGGADESRVQVSLGMSNLGFNMSKIIDNRLADDFVTSSTIIIDSIVFFGYQTNAPIASTINWANIRIWDGTPGSGGNIVFGDTLNHLSDTGWSEIYRVTESTSGNTQRAVQRIVCDYTKSNILLTPGTYWLDFQTNGNPIYSGPWMPPITLLGDSITGNALHYTGSWNTLLDDVEPQGIPFIIYATIDIAPYTWLYPQNDVELTSSTDVAVLVKNTGGYKIDSFDIAYSIDSGVTYTTPETVYQIIMPNETYVHRFGTTADFSEYRKYNCSAIIILNNDVYPNNDTLHKSIYNFREITTYPYNQDFEGQHYWHHDMILNSDSWELGEPEGIIIDTVPSSGGINVWMTDLDENYPNNEQSYVISPSFDLSSLTDPYLSFDINYESADYTSLEYSLNNGKTWKTYGSTNSQGYNWYNVDDNDEDYWSGSSSGWQTAIHEINDLAGIDNVLFRVKFKSDGAGFNEGFAFDNFRIYEPVNDLAVTEWLFPTKGCNRTASDSVVIKVMNLGTVPQDSFLLYYSVDDGATTEYDTMIQSIAPGGELIYTFPVKADFSGGAVDTCYAGVFLNGDDIAYNDNVRFSLSKGIETNAVVQDFEGALLINGWAVESQSNYMWILGAGSTPTEYTGPAGSNGGTFYAFTPAFAGFPDYTTTYYSPCLDLSGNDNGSLIFWSHMYGSQMGELHVDVFNSSGWQNDELVIQGEQQASSTDPWQKNTVILDNDVTQIRIRGINGEGIRSDIAIDDINIDTIISANDVEVTSLDNPLYYHMPAGSIIPKATISNNGGVENTFKVTIESGSYKDSTNLTLGALESQQAEFQLLSLTVGSYLITVITHLVGDQDTSNDTLIFAFDVEASLTKAYAFNTSTYYPQTFYLEHPENLYPLETPYFSYISNGTWIEGKWYAVRYSSSEFVEIDTLTGETRLINNTVLDNYLGFSYDPITYSTYALTQSGSLYSVNLSNGDFENLGAVLPGGIQPIASCYAGEDSIYAISFNHAGLDSLYLIDINTLTSKAVQDLGYDHQAFLSGMEYNHNNDTIYLIAVTSGPYFQLRWIDLENDTTHIIDTLANQYIANLAIPYKATERAEIVDFSIPDQLGYTQIDRGTRTITINMPYEYVNKLDNLVASFVLTEGTSAQVSSVDQNSGVTANDFNSSVVYSLTNGAINTDWTINVVTPPCGILSYSFAEQTDPAEINDSLRRVYINVHFDADISDLIASFTLSPGAVAKVFDSVQTSGVTSNNYGKGGLPYWIVNGNDSLDWFIEVTQKGYTGNDIYTYGFAQQAGPSSIDDDERIIDVICQPDANLSSLIASFTLSPHAVAMIGPAHQVSGVTSNNHTSPLIYRVFAEEGDWEDWTVTVDRELYADNDILVFKVDDMVGDEDINSSARTVDITVLLGTDLTSIRPSELEISPGASINPTASTFMDYSLGPVTYTVTAENGKSGVWEITIVEEPDTTDAINELTLPGIAVYPVPAFNNVNIEAKNCILSEIRITDISGEVVYHRNVNINNTTLTIPVNNYSAGVYFIEVTTNVSVYNRRIQIIK